MSEKCKINNVVLVLWTERLRNTINVEYGYVREGNNNQAIWKHPLG